MSDQTPNNEPGSREVVITGPAWRAPEPELPAQRLTTRELIARAEYLDQIAHTGSPADRADAVRELDAVWDEAERRAESHPATSMPAQVAGYIGLVREDDDYALAAETATWRAQLDALLQPVDILAEDREPASIPTAHDLDADRATADPVRPWGRDAAHELTLEERADRAQSLTQAAGVDAAGPAIATDPDTDIYTDPTTGDTVRLDGQPGAPATSAPPSTSASSATSTATEASDVVELRASDEAAHEATGDWDKASTIAERDGYVVFDPATPGGFRALHTDERDALVADARTAPPRWTADDHEAYLDSRRGATTAYNPAAEYGDPGWREPASDAEAAARTAWLAESTPPAPGWPSRPLTPVEDALAHAQERGVLSNRAHDSDPYAWVEYQRLHALDRLAPLPVYDALDGLPLDEHGQPDTLAGPDRHEGEQVAREPRADEAAFDDRDASTQREALDDPDRLRQRIENLRDSLAGEAQKSVPDEDEQRREQLARWYDDDHRVQSDPDLDSGQDTHSGHSGEGGADELGWGR
ncbi:hypothetical protein [Actinomycetospora straminea]|uniref:Uncharacterized protein n=1 Tax=Actinomycetospora straminea TaxID=663607 RepID=A0ABP9F8Z1_9PSEU|nr:hypothetical protein [Actinomycetospora straminea]MDD7936558.1 hypothetical protein [Actinomycetospora straminea]